MKTSDCEDYKARKLGSIGQRVTNRCMVFFLPLGLLRLHTVHGWVWGLGFGVYPLSKAAGRAFPDFKHPRSVSAGRGPRKFPFGGLQRT